MRQKWIVRIWNYLGFYRDVIQAAQTPVEAIELATKYTEYYVMKAEVIGVADLKEAKIF